MKPLPSLPASSATCNGPQVPPLAIFGKGSLAPGKADSDAGELVLPKVESGSSVQENNDARMTQNGGHAGGNYDNDDGRSLAELGRDYVGLINAIEDELSAVEGLEGLKAQARKGRSQGAKFCWKPAMGDDTAGAAKSTSISRAWRSGGRPSGSATSCTPSGRRMQK